MAKIENDAQYILEDGSTVSGNVLKNDLESGDKLTDIMVVPGSVESSVAQGDINGLIQGKYGTLQINSDGTYTYTITEDMNKLGAGVDVKDEFTYNVEKADGKHIKDNPEKLTITIHGENDKVKISDVTASAYEANANSDVLATIDPVKVFKGQLELEDIDPNKAGDQYDVDENDKYAFTYIPGSVKVTSSDVAAKYLPKLTDGDITVNPDGTYGVKGNFDALSEGETATVTFQYAVEEKSTEGVVSMSDIKTVTMTIVGTNDPFSFSGETIRKYDELIDGDIYKSILANDKHAPGVDVNEKIKIINTGYADIQFWQNGGEIDVDNAAQTLAYKPGSGGAIEKDHFKFWYQVTDGYTDNLDQGGALAKFEMENIDQDPIDFYQFGEASDDKICGIAGKTNVLSGMKGNDKLYGKEKGDILYGGDGQDYLEGGWGNDVYKGGKGNDGIVDTRGNDTYVFSKGDGRDTIDDLNLEIYTDAMGHETINKEFDDNFDVVLFDKTVDKNKVAIYQEKGTQYDSLIIKYSENPDDIVSIGWDQENHYGIEEIQFADGSSITEAELETIIIAIATTDIDPNTAGVQLAQNVHDVQNSQALMTVINNAVA